MNGTRPKFMENQVPAQSYFEQPNPYVNAPSCHVNLLELSRYAKRCGKKLVELTQDEVKKFSMQATNIKLAVRFWLLCIWCALWFGYLIVNTAYNGTLFMPSSQPKLRAEMR